MKRIAKIIISTILLLGAIVGLSLLSSNSKQKRSKMRCNDIEIVIADSIKFISEANVRSYLIKTYGQPLGKKIDSIDLYQIESIFHEKESVTGVQAWLTDDGILHLNIKQRIPVLRFMSGAKGFYVDENGYIFPLHNEKTAPVPVIEGAIPINEPANFFGYPEDPQKRQWILDMIDYSNIVQKERHLKNTITNFIILKDGDIAFKLNRGGELFVFGDMSRFKEKVDLIDEYYTKIAPYKDKDYYKKVNLKYKKQIICRTDI